MADVAIAASAATSASTPVAKKAAPKRGRKPAKAVVKSPKSPAARTAKSSTAKPKIPRAKAPSNHPTYLSMITEAITALKDKKGASTQAILKHISAQYALIQGDNHKQIKSRLNLALKKGVSSGALNQVTGNGANGRFRIQKAGAPASAPATPVTPKTQKKTTKSAKTVAAKSPSEKKQAPKKVAVKPTAKKGKKTTVAAKKA